MQEQCRAVMERAGVLRRGHFRRASGRHADGYVQCAHLFEDPAAAREVCEALADKFRGHGAQLVVSPAVGGVILCYEVARALGIRNVYTERKDGAMVLRRGFRIAPGTRVLIVEDEVTTGTSVRETIEIVRVLGGEVVGIGCLVDKSGGKVAFDFPFEPLVSFKVENYKEPLCPLCAQGKPLDTL